MSYTIFNYHYIRDRGDHGIHPCTIEAFQAQFEYLRTHTTLVSPSELYRIARQRRSGRFAAFTFDDGLREHFTVAFPLLKTAGIAGAFFPLELPTIAGLVPLTNKLHVILGSIQSEDIVKRLERFLGPGRLLPRDHLLNPNRRFDDVLTANLKETLITLSYDERERFLDEMFHEIVSDEAQFAREFFLSRDEIREMHINGMEIGSHTSRHIALNTLSPKAQEEEISIGTSFIEAVIGKHPRLFSYPHGRYTRETIDILKRAAYEYAFILGARSVSHEDGSFEIPRFDSNDFETVRSSL